MDSLVVSGELSSCSTWASLGVARGLSRPVACRILVLQAGIEPESAVLQGGFLTTRPPRKSPNLYFKIEKTSHLSSLSKVTEQQVFYARLQVQAMGTRVRSLNHLAEHSSPSCYSKQKEGHEYIMSTHCVLGSC